jgi:hypothetical protein
MSKRVIALCGALALLLSMAALSFGQVQTTTVTKVQTTQNPDGTYTIVEYPVDKQTVVTLTPVGLTGATGNATILRAANGTTVTLNLNGLPADTTALNLYAVDPTGAVTLLGPVEIANGVGTFTTTTPLSRFMLITSPEAALSAYDANTKIFFRSDVPTGLSVIPLSGPSGEKVAATVAATTDYAVPMLGIPAFKKGDDTKLKLNFSGPLEGARANVFITPKKNNALTKVKMRFHELKDAPAGMTYYLWAVSADGQFHNLGTIVNLKDRHEAEINAEVPFPDFGLFLTTEPVGGDIKTIIKPTGTRVGFIELIP